MCNIGNLLLGLGILLSQPLLVRVAVIWSLPGAVVWCLYVVPTWGLFLTGRGSAAEFFGVVASTLAHLGGLAVGILVLRKIRINSGAWMFAFIWYLIVQVLSRLFTPVAFNVNVSQRIQDGWEGAFASYRRFWLVLTVLVALSLWLLNLVLKQFWPVLHQD